RTALPAPVQPRSLLARLRAHPPQRGGADAGEHTGDGGWDDAGEDRPHHRGAALRAVPMDAGPARLRREEALGQAAATRHPALVRQAAPGGRPAAAGGLLRAAILRALPRLPTPPRVP